MKKNDVRIGATYSAKISGAVVPVKLESVSKLGGWNARNLKTGRAVRIKSAAKLREELEPAPKPVREPLRATIADYNALRAMRHHLSAQVEAGIDTPSATLGEAEMALSEVDGRLKAAEEQLRDVPEAQYLFVKPAGRARVQPLQVAEQSMSTTVKTTTEEVSMASKSKAVQLEETLVALRKAEKLAGTTKWALSGAGAAKNPPSPEKKAHLEAKLAKEQGLVAELRAKRDALKPAPKASKEKAEPVAA